MRDDRRMTILRLDPRLAIVWRSPDALQLGAERPRVVLDPVGEREERMLAALRFGVPPESLAAAGRCSAAAARAFLRRVAPAIERAPDPPVAAHLRVRSARSEEIVATARSLGLVGSPSSRPRVGVVVADHAVPLAAYRDWVRDGLPHFAVVFGDETVTVGPLVVPGASGCLRCADLARRDADAAWPAIASQLITMHAAAADDAVVRTEALCAATRLAAAVSRGITGVEAAPGRRFRRGGGREEVRIVPHPECGCMLDLQSPLAA